MIRTSKTTPCPICKKPNWCLIGDRFVLCMRVAGGREHTLKSGEIGWLHPVGSETTFTRRPQSSDAKNQPDINVYKIHNEWCRNTSFAQLERLASLLRVRVSALGMLAAAWAAPHNAWAFPMKDGTGRLIGIRLRTEDGSKFAVRGSRSGLFFAPVMPRPTIYVVEGPTDTAAALSMGLCAVGKPSCGAGNDLVRAYVVRNRVERAVLIADNDAPGIHGADTLATQIGVPCCTMVPPCKDLRKYVQLGGSRALLESGLKSMKWHLP